MSDDSASDDPHKVLAEAKAAGERIDVALAQIRSRARVALAVVVVLVLALVAVGIYEVTTMSSAVNTIRSNQTFNKATNDQTNEAQRIEYEVACGVAAHYGVNCPPFPKRAK